MKRKALAALFLILCSMAAWSCVALAWNSPSPAAKAIDATDGADIRLSTTQKTIKKGATFTIKSSVTPKVAKSYVRYTSSNTSIARVSQAGKVKGVGYGDVVITAAYGDDIATCSVTVTAPLQKIALNAKTSSARVGDLIELKIAAMEPFNADVNIDNASWTSSNKKVATVSGGQVLAVGVGKAKITAKLNGKVASCNVTISAAAESSGGGGSGSSGFTPANTSDANTPSAQPTAQPAQQSSGGLEQQILQLVNEERSRAGLSKLSYYTPLEASADLRAEEISRTFSHTRPNGSSCFTAIKFSFQWAGENIALGFNSPQQVMNAWMNSPGHRANILSKNYREMAVGIYQKDGTTYWVQLFTQRK